MSWRAVKVCRALQRRKAVKRIENGDCIFCRIARGEIPCRKVYEDGEVLAFHDINPVAPVHFMLIPKLHLASLLEAEEGHAALLGRMLLLASKLAKDQDWTRVFVP